jgi:hypothetical protein
MTSRAGAAVLLVLMFLVPSPAAADWTLRPFLGATVQSSHGFVDLEQTAGRAKLMIGAGFGWHPTAVGFEVELAMAPGFLSGPGDLVTASGLTSIMGNVTWQLPRPSEASRLRAYISGGAGVIRVSLEDALDAFSSDTSLWAGNAGGGVLVRVRPRLDVNGEVRYFRSQFGDADSAGFSEQFVTFTRVTVGAVVRF